MHYFMVRYLAYRSSLYIGKGEGFQTLVLPVDWLL